MNKLIKITAVLSVSILLQACAPQAQQQADAGTWWRVTPVDIAENEPVLSAPSQAATDTSSIVPSGKSYRVFSAASASRYAVYNCAVQGTTDRFVSKDVNCEGQQRLGLLGYVERAGSGFASNALYRCAGYGMHLDTTQPQDCLNHGLRIEGTLGFVP